MTWHYSQGLPQSLGDWPLTPIGLAIAEHWGIYRPEPQIPTVYQAWQQYQRLWQGQWLYV